MESYLPYPSNSAVVVYARHHGEFEDSTLDQSLGYLIDDLQQEISGLTRCEKWMDGNGAAVLENEFAYIGISEQFGRIAVWVSSKGTADEKTQAWAKRITGKLEDAVRNSLGGVFTLEEMLKSSPMPKSAERANECLGKHMTIKELRQVLKDMDGKREVRIAIDPDQPKQYAIGGAAVPFVRPMWKQPIASKADHVLFLAAGDPLGRLPDSAAAQFGWKTRGTSLKDTQGEGN